MKIWHRGDIRRRVIFTFQEMRGKWIRESAFVSLAPITLAYTYYWSSSHYEYCERLNDKWRVTIHPEYFGNTLNLEVCCYYGFEKNKLLAKLAINRYYTDLTIWCSEKKRAENQRVRW